MATKLELTDYRESRLRSLLKGLSWRFVATGTTILISWILTGDIEIAMSIGGTEFVAKLLLFYLHERVWQYLPRGSIRRLYKRNPKSDD